MSDSLVRRLWLYQGERFPVFKHGVLILSFSFCAVCLSSLLRGEAAWPGAVPASTAFVSLFLFFLQLRISDELKDRHEDARFRPERPVPRGLVTLAELKAVAALAMAIQLGLALWLTPLFLILLVAVWGYMALMSVEFFAAGWLKDRPFTYMWSHMLIMPLIDLYATACDWLVAGAGPPAGLPWFLAVSFFNGIVIEVGRKVWAPEQERPGVESYSASWGSTKALLVWLGAVVLSVICAWRVALLIDRPALIPAALGALSLVALVLAVSFSAQATPRKAALLENFSGLWVAVSYVVLGIVPMLLAAGLPL